MKIKIDKTLLKFELEQLFATKQGLIQFAGIQFVLLVSSISSAGKLHTEAVDYWSNYILVQGFFQSLLLNAMIATELFVKPKTNKTIEMLLATSLRPQTIAATSVLVCAIFNSISLLIAFIVLAFSMGRLNFNWIHLMSFIILILANGITLIWTAFIALQTKYGNQMASGFILATVGLLIAAAFYQFSINTAFVYQTAFAGGLALLAVFSGFIFKYFDKEKILLS